MPCAETTWRSPPYPLLPLSSFLYVFSDIAFDSILLGRLIVSRPAHVCDAASTPCRRTNLVSLTLDVAWQAVEALLDLKVKVDIRNSEGKTALELAKESKQHKIVEALVVHATHATRAPGKPAVKLEESEP